MITFLIPTAKEMKPLKTVSPETLPDKSQALLEEMTNLSLEDLIKAYKVKPELAQKEADRWEKLALGQAETYPALELFNGLMYRHMKRDGLSAENQTFMENQVFITSSFYGIIPAFYPIAEHRHDFHTKVKVAGQSLKAFWRPDYDAFLQSLKGPVVSLLSSEFEEVFSPDIREKLITVRFMEERGGGLKTHSTISKKARGAFLTAAMENSCQTVDNLRQLQFSDFQYREDLSTVDKLVFVKRVE